MRLSKAIFIAPLSAIGTLAIAMASLAQEPTAIVDEKNSMQVVNSFNNPEKQTNTAAKFDFEVELDNGDYVYIVELDDATLTQSSHFRATRSKQSTEASRTAFLLEKKHMQSRQQAMLSKMSEVVGNVNPVHTYQYAVNGFALRMSQADALKLSQMRGISRITRDKIHQLDTDRGPTLIGAPVLWEGQVSNLLANQGEGVVVGILDSGINSDHPSFAEVSGDGYTHTNPLGNGNFIGDCANGFPQMCNNKLIGVRSYPVITNVYSDTDIFPADLPRNGEDYDGHGSHVASIAIGNVLPDQAEILPEAGAEESNGIATEFSFEQISGVAPRANVIAYQVCYPGDSNNGDTWAGCPTSAINAGIDSAIADGVDVINFSISGGGDPWDRPTERAFLSAREAGIFVAVSAGNSGPNPSSSEKSSPWYAAVAASEHGRQNGFVKEINNYSGGIITPPVIQGQSDTGSIRAPIVYAGDFTNSNDPDGDPAQCLEPFPTGTFSGQIVVCDRGEIARVQKAENVSSGGAGGFVLANVDGGETFLANDQYVVPGIHIKADEGNQLKNWLSSGSGHTATITEGIRDQFISDDRVDVVANFSSRGPNQEISTLTPTMTAPGVDIFAAFADQQFGRDGDVPPAASDFNYLQGTSMSSPHVAGAGALLTAIHPNWTPDEIKSALSMTATPDMRLDDETTAADYFDMGAGRIQVDLAAQVGLTMDVTVQEYINANPDIGGEPRALNLPSITDNNCRGTCVWERTFTATQDGSWTVSGVSLSDGLVIGVAPQSFDIQAGQTQTVTVTIDSIDADKNRIHLWQVAVRSCKQPYFDLAYFGVV